MVSVYDLRLATKAGSFSYEKIDGATFIRNEEDMTRWIGQQITGMSRQFAKQDMESPSVGKISRINHIGELSIISDGRQDEGFAPIWNISISSCIKLFWLNIRLPILVEKPN